MVKSMFSGVSGLKAHQQKMDVIGNNIANVNTWGFKAYSYNFQDSIYTTAANGAAGAVTTGAQGGRNPSQIGYGASMGSIGFSFTGGSPSPTGNDLDCMIDGTGFFLVGGMINGSVSEIKGTGLSLSRVGIFSIDANGYIVDDQRNYVYGYALKNGTGIPEKPATKAVYEVKGEQVTFSTQQNQNGKFDITIHGITVESTSTNPDQQLKDWISGVAGVDADFANYSIGLVKFDQANNTVDLEITAKKAGDDSGNAATIIGKFTAATATESGSDLVAAIAPEYEDTLSPIQIPIDPDTGERYQMQSYSISENGVLSGVDVQNRPISFGQIALVSVENPNGLEKSNGYYFGIGDNAGDVKAMKANGGPVGTIRSKYLEMANVDLANEFSNMITTQRGFQANSKIITVTDEMLQELVNMKR